jgi:branched-chain amino acid transport system ATP-binding protein
MSELLKIANLEAGYGKKTVVHKVDLGLSKNEIVVILGHNGAGKTTLLKSVFGLIRVRAGEVWFDGKDVTGRSPSANIADGLALVPQGHGIFRTLTVRQNLDLGAFGVSDSALIEQRLAKAFELFPILAERQPQIAGTLSGGQQQMLAIGIALMSGPRLLILDEPSIGLAPLLVERVMASIREINQTLGTTILLVEQNLKYGLSIATRAVVLNRGAKIFDGDPKELADHTKLVAMF